MLYGGMLACAERGYRMIFELIDTHSTQVEREVNAALSSLRPDGVILTPPHSDNPAIIDLLVAQHMPFARIGSDDASADFAIRIADGAEAEAATATLLGLGHQRLRFTTHRSEIWLSRQDGRGAGVA